VAPSLGTALLCTGRSLEDILHPGSLSVLQEGYAAHSERLASALEIVNSYTGPLYYECTATAYVLRSIIEETGIFEVLSPLHPDGLAPDTPSGLIEAATEHGERLASAFAIVSTLADLLDTARGIGSGNDLRAVFEASGILRILDPKHVSSAARIEVAGTMASPTDTAHLLADRLDDYYLPPDECYDWLDDDEAYAEYILGRSGEHRTVGGKATDRFKQVLAVLRSKGPRTVANLT
jgi:hypothetical protein